MSIAQSGMISCLLAYLLGSVSFSFIFTKWIKKVDIRDFGSGNAGATNTKRVLGTKMAVLVLLLDGCKGAAAVGLGYALTASSTVMVVSGLMAIIGHNWPIFLRFRGGKGIATTIGVTAALVFLSALISGLLAILFIVLTRYVSLGSLVYTICFPVIVAVTTFFQGLPISYLWGSLLMAILAVFQHRKNIKQLIQGTERKI